MTDERTPLISGSDPRRGLETSSTTTAQGDSLTRSVPLNALDVHAQFCFLVGVPPTNAPPANDKKSKSPSWPKNSLYGRATRQLRSQSNTYAFTAALSNTLLLSQVVLGAAVTGLGASASSHILITIFGAMNTIIAGLVAYLKSRGQPMRARMYRDDLERVVDEIENSEVMWLGIAQGVQGYGELAEGGDEEVTVRAEVARLTRLYDRAVRNNTANNPDSYVAGPGLDPTGLAPRPGGLTAAPQPIAIAAPAPAPAPVAAGSAAAAPLPPPPAPVDPDVSPASAPPKRTDTPKPAEAPTTAGSSTATLVPTEPAQQPSGNASPTGGQDSSAPPAPQAPQTSQASAPPPAPAPAAQTPAAAQSTAPVRDENAPGAVAKDDDDQEDPATKKLPHERIAVETSKDAKVEPDTNSGANDSSGGSAPSAKDHTSQPPAPSAAADNPETTTSTPPAAGPSSTAPGTTPSTQTPALTPTPAQTDVPQAQPQTPTPTPARDPDESPASAPPRKKATAKKPTTTSTVAATPDSVAAGKGDGNVTGVSGVGKENDSLK